MFIGANMFDKKSDVGFTDTPTAGIYAMLLEVLQSIANASDLHDLLTGAFVRLRWIVNLDYCSASFYRKATDDRQQGVIVTNGIVDKEWQWQENQALDAELIRATQLNSKVIIKSREDKDNLFKLIFDEHNDLQQIACFSMPIMSNETAFIIIGSRQGIFEPQALNILNVFMEFLFVNIVKQRYTEDLSHTLSTLENTQKQLIESEKMRALSCVVAGVAHEINTPLGVAITASSHLTDTITQLYKAYEGKKLTKNILEDSLTDAQESSDILTRNLYRATELIGDFKQIAVDQSSEKMRQFELREYLNEVIHTLKPKLREGGHTVTVDASKKIVLNSFPGVFAQVLTNLIVNSIRHAFQKGVKGNIYIKLSVSNKEAQIDYKDNGQGLNAKQRAQVFEPFYTTARFSGGTGLGMSICYNLVTTKLNGQIHCLDCKDGAHFKIHSPIELKE